MSEKKSDLQQENTNQIVQQDNKNKKIEHLSVEEIECMDVSELESLDKSDLVNVVMKCAQFSGPIPPPNILGGYEDICSGAADRIIKMAENEQSHRHTVDSKMISTESRDSLLGIISALVIALAALGAGVTVLLLSDNSTAQLAGGVLGVSGIGSIVGVFLKGTTNSWKKNPKKNVEEQTSKIESEKENK